MTRQNITGEEGEQGAAQAGRKRTSQNPRGALGWSCPSCCPKSCLELGVTAGKGILLSSKSPGVGSAALPRLLFPGTEVLLVLLSQGKGCPVSVPAPVPVHSPRAAPSPGERRAGIPQGSGWDFSHPSSLILPKTRRKQLKLRPQKVIKTPGKALERTGKGRRGKHLAGKVWGWLTPRECAGTPLQC